MLDCYEFSIRPKYCLEFHIGVHWFTFLLKHLTENVHSNMNVKNNLSSLKKKPIF